MIPTSTLARVALLAATLTTTQAFADEVSVGTDQQTGVAVTIYNSDLALIRDQRKVDLKSGLNELAFIDVSAAIRPETALLTAQGGGFTVTEQNFDFDLLTPQKLLEKSVGGTIRVIRTNPTTGEDSSEEAKVLSVAQGMVVLQIGDRIETAMPGRLVFSAVPPNLRARPTLVTKALSEKAGPTTVALSYLSHGLSWRADYVASLSADEKTLDLNGLVTLTNQSGVTYKDAKLQLVAGQVNQVQEYMELQMDIQQAAGAPAESPPAMTQEQAFEYHLYRLSTPVTIQQNQTKQVAMMAAAGVPVSKQYLLTNAADVWNRYGYDYGESARINATVKLKFVNDEKSQLGMPLPKGIVRVYKADSQGEAVFVGEDSIDHTPKNEDVSLTLGQAFDITARTKQTDYERLSDRIFENEYEIEIKNAKREVVTVDLREHMPGEWKILKESQAHKKLDAYTAGWLVNVPAEGSAKLSYRVRIEF
ncbi:DUF4139 domain-containing protein [Dongia sp.]|uniref:DUF4139 domain-containing protein n=1 Tax=Dongia sp. TaxID=1977262 RepID=UPI0037503B41